MNILEIAIRRILIRNTDKAISTAGRNLLIELTEYSPSLPTVKGLISNVVAYVILSAIPIYFFIIIGIPILGHLVLVPFIWVVVLAPIFRKKIYGRTQTSIVVADRRFKSGTRTVGYQYIKDKSIVFNYTLQQIKLSRIEGIIKLFFFLTFLALIANDFTSAENKFKQMRDEDIAQYLKLNDTLAAKSIYSETNVYIKIIEKKKYFNELQYDTSYKKAYTDTSKALGYIIKLDTIRNDSFPSYLAFNPFYRKDTTYNLKKTQKRFDSLFYINASDATITFSNFKKYVLPKY